MRPFFGPLTARPDDLVVRSKLLRLKTLK